MVLNQDVFASWETFGIVVTWKGATGIPEYRTLVNILQWQLVMMDTSTKNFSAPDVNSGMIEKPWYSRFKGPILRSENSLVDVGDKTRIFWDSPGPLGAWLLTSTAITSITSLLPAHLYPLGCACQITVVLRKLRPWRGTCGSWGWLGMPPGAHMPLFVQTPHEMRCQTSKGWLSCSLW